MAYKSSYTFSATDHFSKQAKDIAASLLAMNTQLRALKRLTAIPKNLTYANITKATQKVDALTASMIKMQQVAATGATIAVGGAGGGSSGGRRSGGGGVSRRSGGGLMNGAAFGAGVPMIGRNFILPYVGYKVATGIYNTGADMETGVHKLGALTGLKGDQLGMAQNKIAEQAKTFGIEQSAAIQGMIDVANSNAQLIGDMPALFSMSDAATKLAIAGDTDPKKTSEGLTRFMKGFHAKRGTEEYYAKLMAAASKYSASEIADTSQFLKRGAGSAYVQGLTPEQTMALAASAAPYRKAGVAGTQVAGILRNVGKGTSKLKGLSWKELGLKGTFDVLNAEFTKLTTSAQRNAWASDRFGTQFAELGLQMMRDRHKLPELEKNMSDHAALTDMFNSNMSTTHKKMQTMQSGFAELGVTLFNQFKPNIDAAINGLTLLATAATNAAHYWEGSVDNMFDYVGGQGFQVGLIDKPKQYIVGQEMNLDTPYSLPQGGVAQKEKLDITLYVDQQAIVRGASVNNGKNNKTVTIQGGRGYERW